MIGARRHLLRPPERGNYANTIRFNGDTQESFTIRNAVFDPNNLPVGGQQGRHGAGPHARSIRNLNAPYSINASLTVERQLPKGLVGTFTYFHDRGIHQFRTRNINAPFSDLNDPGVIIFPFSPGSIIYQTESSARSSTNRLDFGLNRRLGRVTAFGRYSLGWMKSTAAVLLRQLQPGPGMGPRERRSQA